MGRKTWSDEWKRTAPDIVVYLPEEENGFDATNQHFLVKKSPSGTWLAFWTRGADEGEPNQSVAMSRSTNQGVPPQDIRRGVRERLSSRFRGGIG